LCHSRLVETEPLLLVELFYVACYRDIEMWVRT